MPNIRHLLMPLLALSLSLPTQATELDRAVQQLADTLTVKNQAKVVKVSGDKLYLNIGKGQGVLPGHSFEIVRLGDAIVVDGETLGHEEQTIATAKVLRSTDKLTITTAIEQSETPRIGDQAYQQRKDIARIVVAAPTYQGAITELGNEIQDKLINALVDQGVSVVERSRLEEVLREQKLSYSGLIDLGSAKQVGKLLGADAIILGSIRDASNSVATNLRLVDLENGVALAGASVEVAKTPDIARGMGRRQQRIPHLPSTKPEAKKSIPTWEDENIRVTAVSLQIADGKTILNVKFFNKKKKPIYLNLLDPKQNTYLIDPANQQLPFSASTLTKKTFLGNGASRIVTMAFDGQPAINGEFEWAAAYHCWGCDRGYLSTETNHSAAIRGISLR